MTLWTPWISISNGDNLALDYRSLTEETDTGEKGKPNTQLSYNSFELYCVLFSFIAEFFGRTESLGKKMPMIDSAHIRQEQSR